MPADTERSAATFHGPRVDAHLNTIVVLCSSASKCLSDSLREGHGCRRLRSVPAVDAARASGVKLYRIT